MRLTVRTTHDNAARVAAAIHPDNTPEIDTRVDGDVVETTIDRETVGSAQASLDDYLVNLRVATRIDIETITTTEPTTDDNE